tara:strand:- start:12222 stop:13373 length:1152 start_codon:yes stop_codon:yes gene_type:complete
MSEYIVFGKPKIEEIEIQEVVNSLRSGWIGTGSKVNAFEKEIQRYKGSGHPVAVNSCTAALHLSMLCSDLNKGDEVITTALTFAATINSIIHAGLKPVIVDVDPITKNIDPQAIRSSITAQTKALLIVHFAGYPCEMEEILSICKDHNLKLIEDCAHAIETKYHNKPAGTFGDFGCFSFYVTKNITTGEGGMILAKEKKTANRCKVMALHGMSKDAWNRYSDNGYKHYQVIECGFKYNMIDLQASMGLHQLKGIEKKWKRRQEIWAKYQEAFKELPIEKPADIIDASSRHAYHLYTIQISKIKKSKVSRDEFLNKMHQLDIGTGVHYLSIADHPYYQKQFKWNPDNYPIAQRIGRTTASIPLSANLNEKQVNRVINAVHSILS